MTGWVKGYLLLGSNLGDKAGQMRQAIASLSSTDLHIIALSSIYETAAWGVEDQPSFLNQVIAIETSLAPLALLHHCQQIEAAAGPRKTRYWGARYLDIDILYYGHRVITHPQLTVPHPYLAQRRFTLAPLAEIAPEWLHPQLHQTNAQLLHQCADTLPVEKWEAYAA